MLQILNLDNTPLTNCEIKHLTDSVDGVTFNLESLQADTVYSVYKNQLRLNKFFDYSITGNTLTLAQPVLDNDFLVILPVAGLKFQVTSDASPVISGLIKRNTDNIYDACFIFSKDNSVEQKDFSQDAEFLNGVGYGFSGLEPNSLIGMAVVHAYGFRGFITSNTATTITLDTDYTLQAMLQTDVYSIGDIDFSIDQTENKVYSKFLSLPPFLDDTPLQFYARSGLTSYPINSTLTSIVIAGDEF